MVGRDAGAVVADLVAGAVARSAVPLVVPSQVVAGPDEWSKIVGIGCWLLDAATDADPQQALLHRAAFAWHAHFVTTLEKAFEWDTLWNALTLLHRRAFSPFPTLAKEVSIDPAMLLFLDNAWNEKDAPQENFARELMELFTLGRVDRDGRPTYAQADVVEMAKAWTGHGVTERPRTYRFSPDSAVGGTRLLFGQTGTWSGPPTIDVICSGPRRPVVARHVARRLCTELWGRPPSTAALDRVAAAFETSGLDGAALFRAALADDELYDGPPALRSPLAFMIETQRVVGMRSGETHPEWYWETMGQFPFGAPDVAGFRPATWGTEAAVWARADWARNRLGWTALERGWLADVPQLAPGAAVDAAASRYRLPLAASRPAIVDWLSRERAASGWGQAIGLHDLLCLSSEMNLQ